jgi:hypothetical protein
MTTGYLPNLSTPLLPYKPGLWHTHIESNESEYVKRECRQVPVYQQLSELFYKGLKLRISFSEIKEKLESWKTGA